MFHSLLQMESNVGKGEDTNACYLEALEVYALTYTHYIL